MSSNPGTLHDSISEPLRAIDLFCGVGGSSWGARMAGVKVVAALDLWPLAQDTYLDNFDGVTFYRGRAEDLNPERVKEDVGSIDLILASPECTSHTCAKGNGKRSEASNMTAFQVNRFAKVFQPRWIVVENVIQMRRWERYQEWLKDLRGLGYQCREQMVNAADFGVPQSRKRLFILAERGRVPPEIIPSSRRKIRTAKAIINSNGAYGYSKLKSKKRAKPTLQRARRAIAELGKTLPFLLVYYGSDGAGGWQKISVPLRTVTTLDRFAYVRPSKNGYKMRMLQVPELKKAMGLPAKFKMKHGVRRDKIKLLGNAVCPPVMKAVIQTLTQGPAQDLRTPDARSQKRTERHASV